MLDPNEGKAYENLDAANQAYDSAFSETLRVAQNSPLAAQVATLGALRAAQMQVQTQVRRLARSDIAAAQALLNAQETPAWRKLRAALLEQMDNAGKNQTLVHDQTHHNANQMRTLAMGFWRCWRWPWRCCWGLGWCAHWGASWAVTQPMCVRRCAK